MICRNPIRSEDSAFNSERGDGLQTRKRKRSSSPIGENQKKKRRISYDSFDDQESVSSNDIANNREQSVDDNDVQQIVGNEDGNNTKHYEVYQILSKKSIEPDDGFDALTYYLVEWSGYDVLESEWVKEDGLQCPTVLKEFQQRIKHLDECEKCKLGGYDCTTVPCFKHHFKRQDYRHIFEFYTAQQARKIHQIKIGASREQVEQYAAEIDFDFDA